MARNRNSVLATQQQAPRIAGAGSMIEQQNQYTTASSSGFNFDKGDHQMSDSASSHMAKPKIKLAPINQRSVSKLRQEVNKAKNYIEHLGQQIQDVQDE
jgi:hypothetical protein